MGLKKHGQTEAAPAERRRAPRDLAGLAEQLATGTPMMRRWAVRDLLELGGDEPRTLLCAHLAQEDDASVREVLLTALGRLRGADAVAALVTCMRSEDAALRNHAIEVMKSIPDEVGPLMRGLLTDADADVRILGVNVLESLRHPQVETWLIDVIEHDANVNVCAAAVDLLGEVGTAASREPLARLLQRFAGEPYIAFAAGIALARAAQE